MGKPFLSSRADIARNDASSLNVYRQSSTASLFSRAPGSAWHYALCAAEILFQEPTPPSTPGPTTPDLDNVATMEWAELSLEDLFAELEAAEKESKPTAKDWDGVLKGVKRNGEQQEADDCHTKDQPSPDLRVPKVSDEIMLERAAQWGYGVVLKDSSRDSTPRSSNASSSAGSCAVGGNSQAIPGISKDVKDALSRFKLAFLVCDATHVDFPILYASGGFANMTGYTADQIVGKSCRFLQGVDTDVAEVGRIRDALKNGRIYTGTLLNYKKDGTPFWNLLTLSPIKDNDGRVIKYIGMQAEQNSRERPRSAIGKKTYEMPQVAAASPACSLPSKPHGTTHETSADRERSAAEPKSEGRPQRRASRGYSLTLTTPSGRNSFDNCELDLQAVREVKSVAGDRATKTESSSNSSLEGPTTPTRGEGGPMKNRGSRRSSRILHLFRKDSQDLQSQESVSLRNDLSRNRNVEDEKKDLRDHADRGSGARKARRSGISINRRSETSVDGISTKVTERLNDGKGYIAPPMAGSNNRQFCIVRS